MYGANEAAVLEDRELPRYIRITDVSSDGTLHDDTFRSLEEEVAAPFLLKGGDILLARSGATVGKSFQYLESWGKAAYAGYLIRYRPDQSIIFPRFANYYFQTSCYWACVYSSLIQSTIENFSAEKYKELKLPLPPLPEQRHVAAFLDWKTGQIDALIAKKQALIEKLKEKRLAVITQAVTKGLDASVPLQDSGIWWLGKVPSQWLLNMKLGFLAASERNSFVNGPFGSDLLTTELVNEGVPVIYSGDVKAINFQRKSNKYVTEAKAQDLEFCRVDGGDILLAKVGDPPGDACVYPIDAQSAVVTQDVVRIRLDTGTSDADFVSFLLISALGRHLIKLVSVEATRGRFSLADLKSLRFPIPGIQEQKDIAKYLKEKLKKAERVISINETAIARLTEYRTALITAATTGQIDVRNVKIPDQA